MRWRIAENKRVIETENLEDHTEFLEMSGERVSGIIGYGALGGKLCITREIVFPNFRIQPNDTFGSYSIKGIEFSDFLGDETFDKAQINGILTLYSHTDFVCAIRRFYPSTTLSVFYEDIEITAKTDSFKLEFEEVKRLDTKLGCHGYFYIDRVADSKPLTLKKGDTKRIIFAYKAYFANENPPVEKDALNKRLARVKELLSVCDLTTGDEVIDTEFAFAKIRAGENIFRTKKGLIHCPGGGTYYAAVWCNDQLEYAAPWFAFTGDKMAFAASENAFLMYEPYMNDKYLPIPSSIIAEGDDYWNGAGDRGDAAMYLFGLSRYLLVTGKPPSERQEKALKWCIEYIRRNVTESGAVFSDTDELEGRLSSGINLSTTSLAYGGLETVSLLWKKHGKNELSQNADILRNRIEKAFEGYFAANIKGYETYAYHKGCDDIRAWNCLPVYMGIQDRAEDTLSSIEDKLWQDFGCKTTEGENITWDRSTLYFITSMFRAGKTEKAFSMLKGYSEMRLLGDRVPYPVEAYPEGNMRHLSAESALFCRVITDGLLNISANENGFSHRNVVPFLKNGVSLKNVFLDGEYVDIEIK